MIAVLRKMLRRSRSKVRVRALASLTAKVLDSLREDPDSIRVAYSVCSEELAEALGPRFDHLTIDERQFAFCTVVAHSLAPFGSDNTCITFPELVRQSTLNCGNYGLLAHYLARTLMANCQNAGRLRVVGWDGPGVGNHQMLFLDRRDGSRSMLLDPTIGLIGDVAFDTVARGQRVRANRFVLFRARTGLEVFEQFVVGALTAGRVRPSDLLYYFDGFDHLLKRYGHPGQWPTPGAATWRERTGWNDGNES